MDYSKYDLNKYERIKCILVAITAGAVLMILFYGKTPFCFFAIAIGLLAQIPYANYLGKKRRNFLKLQFRDLLYSLSASIGSGRHMKAALEEGVTNLSILYPKNNILGQEISEIIAKIESSNQSEKELLTDFAERSAIDEIKSFFRVYYIALSTGGNLTAVIRKAGDILLDKMIIEKDIETYTAQKRFEGRLIMMMPIVIIFFLNIISPGYLAPMYESSAGRITMTACLLAMFLSFRITEKIMQIPMNSGSIKDELPDFINKTVLLMNAGMVLTAAFDVIVKERNSDERGFYKRLNEINNNLKSTNSSFSIEFRKYAIEAGEREMLRLSNVINDSIDKGSELSYKLEKEADFMWHTMKKNTEEKGRIAESKLALPMGIMMGVLITVTTAPAFMSL
ncbi:MAG: type II secretion system F family protein [Eubacteriales bacterium]|nr:type II secretion system F family protein [Eubacteriales bacterium]MDD4389628.1 type II secretion system F family protein [Eubacteriales bacterium]